MRAGLAGKGGALMALLLASACGTDGDAPLFERDAAAAGAPAGGATGAPGTSGGAGAAPGGGTGGALAEADASRSSCSIDRDCRGSDQVCDVREGTCAECAVRADCGAGRTCAGGRCAAVTPCDTSLDCTGAGPGLEVCHPLLRHCVQCARDADCDAGHECVNEQCTARTPCDNSLDCPVDSVCDPALRRCVECAVDADCGGGERCVGLICRPACASDRECTPLGLLCATEAGHCAECRDHGDCLAGRHCEQGQCRPDACIAGEAYCDGNARVACDALGRTFLPAEACPARHGCTGEPGAATCRPWVCTPGERECDLHHAVECAADGLSEIRRTDCSAQGQNCVLGECSPLVCPPGELYCDAEDAIRRCSADGTSPGTLETACGADQYCDGTGASPACRARICTPGATECNATCNARGSGYVGGAVPCPGDEYCVEGSCTATPPCDAADCPECVPAADDCEPGQVCHDGRCCTPLSCTDYPGECGLRSDGCGELISCIDGPCPVFRVTEYPTSSSGGTWNLDLDQPLERNYFAIVRGATGSNNNPDRDYVRITQDPHRTGQLGDSNVSDRQLRLNRSSSTNTWVGVVTVVECLHDCDVNGFELLDVRVLEPTETSGSVAAETGWGDAIDRVMILGGVFGPGVTTNSSSMGNRGRKFFHFAPSGTNGIDWTRPDFGGTVRATLMVLRWGTAWTVQRRTVTGSSFEGTGAASAYDTAEIDPVPRANTWVWGTGRTQGTGHGDSTEGSIVTLGTGGTDVTNADESGLVAVGQQANPGSKVFEVYALTHPDLVVDHLHRPNGTAGSTVDLPTDDASGCPGARMAVSYTGSPSTITGNDWAGSIWDSRYSSAANIRMSRQHSESIAWSAWVQGIQLCNIGAGD